MDSRQFIGVTEAAQILQVAPATVRAMIRDNELRAVKMRPEKQTSPWMILKESIEEFVKNREAALMSQN